MREDLRENVISPSTRRLARTAVCLLFGLVGALIAAHAQFVLHGNGGDHSVLWRAARLVLARQDPYAPQRNIALVFFYPMPAAILGMPFAWATAQWAAVLFVGASATLLGYAFTQGGCERVPLLLSASFFVASQFAQTSIVITALGALAPVAGLAVLKPNLGLALFAWRPSRRFVIVAAIALVASLAISVTWPVRWLAIVRQSPVHHAPVLVPGGVLCLLAAVKWRRPEARLLLAMTLVPHGLYFYDELPLWLIAQTRREAMFLTLTSWLGWFGWIAFAPTGRPSIADMAPWVIGSLYLPALAIVLRRPNVVLEPQDAKHHPGEERRARYRVRVYSHSD